MAGVHSHTYTHTDTHWKHSTTRYCVSHTGVWLVCTHTHIHTQTRTGNIPQSDTVCPTQEYGWCALTHVYTHRHALETFHKMILCVPHRSMAGVHSHTYTHTDTHWKHSTKRYCVSHTGFLMILHNKKKILGESH